MSEIDLPGLLTELADPDPGIRATAVGRVRQVDLDDLGLLARVLELCGDLEPLPAGMQPPTPDDPFAAFFGGGGKAPPKLTVADKARDRLVYTGVIGKPESARAIGQALDAGSSAQLATAATKLLAETRWTDRLGAVRELAPRLMARDAALYEVIVRVGETEHRAILGAALAPYRSRTINELLNHGPSKAITEDALAEAVAGGQIGVDEPSAADALTLLVSWDSRHATRVAAALEPRFPWAVLAVAVGDPSAGSRCEAWLARGEPAPKALVRKLDEVLKTRGPIPGFPLDAWVRYSGGAVEVVRAWKAAGECRLALEGFVRAWSGAGEHPERGWEAAEALLEAGLHDAIGADVLRGLTDDSQRDRWTRSLFEKLAQARPPVPGLVPAATDLLVRHPDLLRTVIPGLLAGLSAEALRPLAERVVALAEARPVVRKPSRKGLIHEQREGIDPAPLQAVVHGLGDPALSARLDDVLPFIRSE